ncbi:natural resistance-associated macrophage protein-domain-containing protein [Pseudomassariella vexata]|uniref:Natural resistance-associated macrophage protein-domain-containing protein n=1 Tax=Pseudomassariella vexata TaxID=1141098 RepID=A0A1Y2DQ07_9PEZI|nr:natural resistance-associated macrophage protein-domain-containing protein [Pseudomassariella vexata]ORY61196.1 natural resistance-associated macrophage protein-domain-containing protein [Pseudomassariella vexata]
MNQTAHTDEPLSSSDSSMNQSPNTFSNDLTTNEDFNGRANARTQRAGPDGSRIPDDSGQALADENMPVLGLDDVLRPNGAVPNLTNPHRVIGQSPGQYEDETQAGGGVRADSLMSSSGGGGGGRGGSTPPSCGDYTPAAVAAAMKGKGRGSHIDKARHTILTFGKFVGPGFLVSVAYIDPGNYATDIAAGASYRFRLLFIVLMSNIFAIFLQCLSVKLGTVTGLNLAEACRAFLPRWLNYFLYAMAEIAIIATDIAEVIGTAIALNLLIPQLPLVAGCAISMADVMLILLFYHPDGSMKALRSFEFFVMLLVMAVVVCFCIQLSLIENTTPGDVFKGYLPNDAITQSDGLYQACGIVGATVMPHSIYLGSGIVQSRLKDYDIKNGLLPRQPPSAASSMHDGKLGEKIFYVPSLKAINHSLKYSYTEVAISLFTFALFVNSAILIVAGASLYNNPDALDADIFGIHRLLSSSISPGAGTIFALALLFSGVSAGIVCTISGQMVCEGALKWKMRPWIRRLITRSISITPSIIIAGAAGREKLNDALNGSQVALSVVLPFVSAPLIYFTCFNKFMTVQPGHARHCIEGSDKSGLSGTNLTVRAANALGTAENGVETANGPLVKMANSWWVSVLAFVIWIVIVVLNVANLVLLGLGK